MNAVILETDQYAKERLILKSNEIISATYSQLAVSKNSMIASALAGPPLTLSTLKLLI